MNILFLFYAPMLPYVGGIQRVSENLAREMSKRGHSVYYLSINSEEKDTNYAYPVPQLFLDDKLSKDDYLESYRSLVIQYSINVVINQEAREDLLEVLAQTPVGVKRITCFHTQPFLTQGKTRQIMKYYRLQGLKAQLYRTLCWLFPIFHAKQTMKLEIDVFDRALRVSDKICLESHFYFNRIIKYMPYVDANKFVAVNNPNTFPSIETSIYTKEKIILWVGRQINTPKNVPVFIDFWVRFHKRNPEWQAVIIGVGPDLEYNKRYALCRKAHNISFLGRVEDVSEYYKKSTFFVTTSMYEGFPMVLIEAMNNGCIPCAFDTFESLYDIIDNGLNGIIAPQYKIDILVHRIERVITDSSTLRKMHEAALEKSSAFTVERIVDKWERLLTEL